jgi:hypothetical protein
LLTAPQRLVLHFQFDLVDLQLVDQLREPLGRRELMIAHPVGGQLLGPPAKFLRVVSSVIFRLRHHEYPPISVRKGEANTTKQKSRLDVDVQDSL